MAEPLQKLQEGTRLEDAYAILNDNFAKVIQDIRDLGADLSTVFEIALTIPATSLTTLVVTLTSEGVASDSANQCFTQRPVSAVTGIAPLLDIFVDVDNDEDYRFAGGSALSVGQQSLYAICNVSQTGYTNSLAAWVIQLNNRDASPHTYYVKTKCGYLPVPANGFYR